MVQISVEKFDLLIAKAASDTLLTSDQVKVNLRKLRYIYNTILLWVNCPKKLRDMKIFKQ